MIVSGFGRYLSQTAHDHENGVPDGEIDNPTTERVWQTVTVTSGRIIIGWRAGT
jgi:hypothetical protein